jgi:hypothetical protein
MGDFLMIAKVLGIAGAILLSVLANDVWALSAPFATRIVVRAARLWARDKKQAEVLTEEWQAYLADRPGQLLKLMTAAALFVAGAGRALARRLKIRPQPVRPQLGLRLRLPAVDARIAETDAVPVALLAGLMLSLTPLIYSVAGQDPGWAMTAWGFGIAVAVATELGAVALGFLVRRPMNRPPSRGPDQTWSERLTGLPAASPEPAREPAPANGALLVRPFVQHTWLADPSEAPAIGDRIRPYVGG